MHVSYMCSFILSSSSITNGVCGGVMLLFIKFELVIFIVNFDL